MRKGIVQLPVLLILAIVALAGAYYVGTSAGKLPAINISLTPTSPDASLSGPPLPPEVPGTSPAPSPTTQASPTPKPKQVIKLKYNLPTGWKTIQDTTGTFEIGYDPQTFRASSGNLDITFAFIDYPGSLVIALRRYDGGSRHQFIYSQGISPQDKMENYYEKEYTINDWSCLVLYGQGFSASGTTWGMCALTNTKALFFGGTDERGTEQMLQTIKLLKTP